MLSNKYIIVDDLSKEGKILFHTNDKFFAECALYEYLILGQNVYLLTLTKKVKNASQR